MGVSLACHSTWLHGETLACNDCPPYVSIGTTDSFYYYLKLLIFSMQAYAASFIEICTVFVLVALLNVYSLNFDFVPPIFCFSVSLSRCLVYDAGLGFVTSLLFVFFVGVFVSSWMGATVFSLGEWIIKKMPFVKHIYSASKQISAAISPGNSYLFSVKLGPCIHIVATRDSDMNKNLCKHPS